MYAIASFDLEENCPIHVAEIISIIELMDATLMGDQEIGPGIESEQVLVAPAPIYEPTGPV